ncbi:MAG: YicC/YloC family endoribonuclease [Marinilabiliaceae bacterium]|nr:YicC family protein [Bacteroidales bacterium]MDD5816713.1 YicC family protein [Bacteroidales bacterium]MDY4519966.1 YicC/YloC family endoribonuclease [Bacteroidales bacterium]
MILSMTGYGKAVKELPNKKISVEIRSLNSKQLDLAMRLPSFYREKELEVRSYLAQRIGRGKVDFAMFCETQQAERVARIDENAVKQYYQQLISISNGLGMEGVTDYMRIIMTMPDVVKVEQPELDETEWSEVMKCIEEAVDNFIKFREQEGLALEKDLRTRVGLIEKYSLEVPKYETERVNKIRQRIQSNLDEIIAKDKVDQNRLEQELIYYIEKLDINEEKVRLANHIKYFLETMEGEPNPGKKLGFITQEMGREINTLGSKANQAEMQRLVVMMKDELEKIKEQILNCL